MSVALSLHHISQDGVTAVMVATANGHPSVVRMLLKAGTTVNTTSQVGYTLNSAIVFGSMILFTVNFFLNRLVLGQIGSWIGIFLAIGLIKYCLE